MMRMIFVNLPVRSAEASKAFFGALGFDFNPQFSDERSACIVIDEAIFVMLLEHDRFKDFIPNTIADPAQGVEVLNCISCSSRDEVTSTYDKAIAAGGKPWMPSQDHGWMMSCSFQDLDSHVWEFAWMDPNGPSPH